VRGRRIARRPASRKPQPVGLRHKPTPRPRWRVTSRGQGSNASDAASQALTRVGQTLHKRIDFLVNIDVFRTLAMVGALMIPLTLIIKPVDLGAPATRP
jgi:hypothetical protein